MTQNLSAIDQWSLVHTLNGLGIGLLDVNPKLALGGAVVYEILEYAHEWPRGSVFFGSKRPESAINIITDVALYSIAYFTGREMAQQYNTTGAGVLALMAAAYRGLDLMPPRLEPAADPGLQQSA